MSELSGKATMIKMLYQAIMNMLKAYLKIETLRKEESQQIQRSTKWKILN